MEDGRGQGWSVRVRMSRKSVRLLCEMFAPDMKLAISVVVATVTLSTRWKKYAPSPTFSSFW